MVPRQTTPRTLYQPTTTRVWEGKEQPTQSSLYRETTPRYLGTSTPRTLFTKPTAEQPALQQAALTRWQQQTPRSLLQQPTSRTSALGAGQFAQPAARTFATSPTRQSWAEWFGSWFKKEEQKLTPIQQLQMIDSLLYNVDFSPSFLAQIGETEVQQKRIKKLKELIVDLPNEYANHLYTSSYRASTKEMIRKLHEPLPSNESLLKLAIKHTRNLSEDNQEEIITTLIQKGADPNFNPQFITPELANSHLFNWQFSPLWQAIFWSNVGALKALLKAGVNITNETPQEVTKATTAVQETSVLNNVKNIFDLAQIRGPIFVRLLTEGEIPSFKTLQEQIELSQTKEGFNEMHKRVTHFALKNPYDILGLSKDATEKDIRNARKQYAKAFNADKFQDIEENRKATEIMQKINGACDEALYKIAKLD